nr:ATP-dependent DNA helicase PIF1-like [Tanacetum cinerariifolium]
VIGEVFSCGAVDYPIIEGKAVKHLRFELPDTKVVAIVGTETTDHRIAPLVNYKRISVRDEFLTHLEKVNLADIQDIRKDGKLDVLPEDFNDLLERKFTFKVDITDYNLSKNKYVYGISQICEEDDVIKELELKATVRSSLTPSLGFISPPSRLTYQVPQRYVDDMAGCIINGKTIMSMDIHIALEFVLPKKLNFGFSIIYIHAKYIDHGDPTNIYGACDVVLWDAEARLKRPYQGKWCYSLCCFYGEITEALHTTLDENNELVKSYQMVRDRYVSQENQLDNVKLRSIGRRTSDGRTYNLPTASEIVVLIVGDIQEALDERDIVVESKTVERLPFHLPGQQQVVYDEDANIDDVLSKPSVASTKFTQWMECNKTSDLAKTLTYAEFSTKFVWIRQKRFGRKESTVMQLEEFILFQNRDALLDDDREYILGLQEIYAWEFGKKVRRSFIHLLMSNSMSRPDHVFNETCKFIKDDIEYHVHQLLNNLAVKKNEGGVFFVYGYGGTKKTYILKTLYAAISSKGEIVLNVVSSDLEALLNKTKLIIWDEAPMMNKHCFEALDKTLRDILCGTNTNSLNIPFGGKVIVFGGDFRQILPVITGGTRQDIVHASLNSSYLWDHIHVLRLTKNMRLRAGAGSSNTDGIKEFLDWILKVGDGHLGGPNDGEAMIDIPNDLLINDCADPVEKVYLSSDSICESEGLNDNYNESLYSPDMLNGMKLAGLPNHRLVLKVSAPVMLLRNIDQSEGLCNRTRLRIKQLRDRAIKAEILTRTKVEETVSLTRFKLTPSDKRLPL